jgi:hypothetical protein
MTLFKSTDGLVAGQPISPFFGAQNGVQGAGATVIPEKNLSPTSGPQETLHEALAKGSIPRNANVTAVGGVSTGQQNATPVDDLMGNGAGNQVNIGAATPKNAGNPGTITTIGTNTQEFVDGVGELAAGLSTGPVPTNTETLTSAPVSGATVTGNVTIGGGFSG